MIDPYTLIILVLIASWAIQASLNAKFKKYSKIPFGMTGAEIARKMLSEYGIHDVQVISTPGRLTDHYNPKNLTINLSDGVYNSNSLIAAAVAAHETGHAIQHSVGYFPVRLRSALVPIVSFASNIVSWVLLLGVLMMSRFPELLLFGIGLFALTTLFSIVTLPVEFDASRRALAYLKDSGMVDAKEYRMAKSALSCAASTYVVAALGSIATLLYYLNIARSRN